MLRELTNAYATRDNAQLHFTVSSLYSSPAENVAADALHIYYPLSILP